MNKNIKVLISIALVNSIATGVIPVYADNNDALTNELSKKASEDKEYIIRNLDVNNENNIVKSSSSNVITFNDPVFEKLVRNTINKSTGDILVSDVENIRELKSNYSTINIEDLSGIEHFANLEVLVLYKSNIQNLDSIPALDSLKELKLDNNVSNIDLSGLNKFKNLELLTLKGKTIDDASQINIPSNLKILKIDSTNIKDLSVISSASSIEELVIKKSDIVNITPIENLTKLKKLDLSDNKIANINPLNNLINLEELILTKNKIKDTTSLEGLINLKNLNIADNDLESVADFKLLENLIYLNVNSNSIVNLSGISNTSSLEELHFNYNSMEDLDFMKNLINIKKVDGIYNNIKNIDGIKNCTEITTLNLDSNHLWNIEPISNLTKIKELGLAYNYIKDVTPLEPLLNLTKCKMSGNFIDTSDTNTLTILQNISGVSYDYLRRLEYIGDETIVAKTGDKIDLLSNFKLYSGGNTEVLNGGSLSCEVVSGQDNISIDKHSFKITVLKEGVSELKVYYHGVKSPHTTFNIKIDSTDKNATPEDNKYIINVKYIDDSTNNEISSIATYTYDKIGSYDIEAKEINGYTLVGDKIKTLVLNKDTKNYNIEFRYRRNVSENNNNNNNNSNNSNNSNNNNSTNNNSTNNNSNSNNNNNNNNGVNNNSTNNIPFAGGINNIIILVSGIVLTILSGVAVFFKKKNNK